MATVVKTHLNFAFAVFCVCAHWLANTAQRDDGVYHITNENDLWSLWDKDILSFKSNVVLDNNITITKTDSLEPLGTGSNPG